MLFKGESLNKLAKIFGNFFLTVNNKLEKKNLWDTRTLGGRKLGGRSVKENYYKKFN